MAKEKYFFLFFLLLMPLVFSQSAYPKIEYFINDYTGLLAYEEIAAIEPTLKEIYDSGAAEYAVVIIDSLNGSDIEGYSYKVAEGNIGDAAKNNGLLLLIAVQDRQYRFEVGRGLEPMLPDIVMGRIGRNYIEPYFKEGNYAAGIREASIAVKDILFNNTDTEYYKNSQPESGLAIGIVIFLVAWSVAILILIVASKNTVPSKRRKEEDYLTAAWLLSTMMKGGKGGFGGSGGFGGFGGGSFGGGGAGGRW